MSATHKADGKNFPPQVSVRLKESDYIIFTIQTLLKNFLNRLYNENVAFRELVPVK